MIQDSGSRKKFESGAVRDVSEGKGRMDLLPLDMVAEFIDYDRQAIESETDVIMAVNDFINSGNYDHLIRAAAIFSDMYFEERMTAVIEYSKHMEEGQKKYGPNNWCKGIPLERYVDSALRHFMKVLRGDVDERHDRAVIWNLLCGAWTAVHKPELNDYAKGEKGEI
jgi:hypothetical protein